MIECGSDEVDLQPTDRVVEPFGAGQRHGDIVDVCVATGNQTKNQKQNIQKGLHPYVWSMKV